MEVFCIKNRGYKWTEHDGSYFRGYIQLYDDADTVLREREAIDYFASAGNFEEFTTKLNECDGVFAVIIRKEGKYWAAVDVARSMPLYYASDCSCISDSSEEIRKHKGIDPEDTDYLRTIEMYKTGYIVNDKTIYSGIRQLEMGHAAEFSGGTVRTSVYFIHANETQNITREEALRQLAEKTDAMTRRMLKVIAGRPIVLSLSGGYDSRYLACSLKDNGAENVSCYTYGKRDSYEIPDAKRVSDACGYKQHIVEYTDQKSLALSVDAIKPYYDYTIQHDYPTYLQNYIAVKELQESGVFPDDAVMITGLCNDMPTGAYIPLTSTAETYGFILDGVANCILDRSLKDFLSISHFFLKKSPLEENIRAQLVEEIKQYIMSLGLEVHDYQSFISVFDCVHTGQSHSRLYLHMNDVHDFFGHEWLLPCWNRELLKFWYSLPVEMRFCQSLYTEYVTNVLGKKYGLTMKKVAALNKSPVINLIKKFMRASVIFPDGIMHPFTVAVINTSNAGVSGLRKLYNLVRQRKAAVYNRISINAILCTYLMEQRYGAKWFGRIRKALQ